MATIDLNLVKQKLDRKLEAHPDFSVHVTDDGVVFEHTTARWSPHPYEDEDALADLLVSGILYQAWLSHSQYLATLFGPRLVGAPLP